MERSTHAVAFFSVLAAAVAGCRNDETQAAPPPPEVLVAEVLQRDVPIYLEALGQTRGSNEVEIRARVEGFLETVEFQEGSLVAKGQLLYTIDPRPFQAALTRAEATRAEAEAQLARARQDVARYAPLVEKNAISREEYETAVAVERAASAVLDAASAEVESARIDLGYTRVEAPIDGLVGKTEVQPGALVGRSQSTLLTQISTLDPIRARVTISEREYLDLASKRLASGKQGNEADFELVLADGTTHAHSGKLVFVDRAVDPRTGTILVEVSFPNPDGLVRPGQYARVRVAVETKKDALLVPQRAVQEIQGLYNVAVVDADGKVEQRTVQPAERVGELWLIESGLAARERIVVEGLQKVRPGITVAAELLAAKEPAAGGGAGSPAATESQDAPAARED